MKLVFDLDGVLRDLNRYLNNKYKIPSPQKWDWKYKNKDIFGWARHDKFKILVEAPPTKFYYNFSHKIKEIWTCQSDKWLPYTMEWIDRYLPNRTIMILNTEEKEKLLYSKKNTYLVEDSPNFKNYDKIIIVDRPYNGHINCKNRINDDWEKCGKKNN